MEIALLIAGMAIVTFAIRYSTVEILGRWDVPPVVRRGLRYVPIAALSAIIALGLLSENGFAVAGFDVARIIATISAIVVAVWSRQMLLTIAVGMGVMWIVQAMLPK